MRLPLLSYTPLVEFQLLELFCQLLGLLSQLFEELFQLLGELFQLLGELFQLLVWAMQVPDTKMLNETLNKAVSRVLVFIITNLSQRAPEVLGAEY